MLDQFFLSKTMFIRESVRKNRWARISGFWALFFLALFVGTAQASQPLKAKDKYPDLELGILGSAQLEPLDEKTLLIADGIKVTEAELMETVNTQEPKLRKQLEKNLLFLLVEETTRRVLMNEAKKAGISNHSGDESRVIQELFARKSAGISVSDEEIKGFYQANREMVGGTPFEQIKEPIRQYLLQDKKQRVIASYVSTLTDSVRLRINQAWMEAQSRLALDNPVDKARRSGRPTMVEFGAKGCIPCDMMQPILDNLRKKYPGQLNVVFIHVGNEQILAARYGIRTIPVQVFYDAKGKEAFRHVGFFPEAELNQQLLKIGVKK